MGVVSFIWMLQSIPPPPKILFSSKDYRRRGGGEVYIIVLMPLDLTKLHIYFNGFFMLLNLLGLLWKEEGDDHGILYSYLLGSFYSLDH